MSIFIEKSVSYDFLRAKSEMHARTPRSAEHALAFSEAWSDTVIDFLIKINNLCFFNRHISKRHG